MILETEGKSEWEIDLTISTWLAAVNAEVGVARLTTDVGLEWGDYSDILDELDMYTEGKLGVRKWRLGAFIDWSYLRLSDETNAASPLLRSASIKIEQLILDGVLTYRILEGERGHLDLMAGARYWYLREDVGINVDSAGINQFSRDASQRIVDDATARVSAAVADAVAKARPIIEDRISDAVREQVGDVTVPGG